MSNLIPIIPPSYNCKRFIKEFTDSILSQTYHNGEMIIVDNHFSDNSAEYIKSLIKNVGVAEARSKALEVVNDRYIAYGLNEVLAKYRLVSTSNTAKKYKAIKDICKVYREIKKLFLIKSSWYFMYYILVRLKRGYK